MTVRTNKRIYAEVKMKWGLELALKRHF